MSENSTSFLDSLNRMPLWVSGSIGLSSGICTWLWANKIGPIGSVPTEWIALISIAGIVGFVFFLARAIKFIVDGQADKTAKVGSLEKPLGLLTERQLYFLVSLHKRGNRYFDMLDPRARYFEELLEWGYVEPETEAGEIGPVHFYRITRAAVKVLEQRAAVGIRKNKSR